MKFLRGLGITAAVLAAAVAGLVVAYKLAFPTYTHRYRLTLEAETPDGLKTASGVIEPRIIAQPKILTDRGSHTGLRGDAVFLDLRNGKNVTALLASGPSAQDFDSPVTLALAAFKIPSCTGAFCEWRAIARTSGARDLSPTLLPTLVTFSDVNDPKTARIIQPSEFEAVFGPGYRFKRAWLEITDEPVTRNIYEKLPFLTTHQKDLMRSRIMGIGDGYVPSMGQFRVGDN